MSSDSSLNNLMYGLSIAQTARLEAQNGPEAALAATARANEAGSRIHDHKRDGDVDLYVKKAYPNFVTRFAIRQRRLITSTSKSILV